ncbi:hypothetical protein MKY41_03890 [Sporosarcina sp. FSL W7-1349]|uniref:hypothetical protein n=1 Tax=Sporosarcina sp. FSL W7-1349 TaxID=2921561 RepID=UPI0030FBC91F
MMIKAVSPYPATPFHTRTKTAAEGQQGFTIPETKTTEQADTTDVSKDLSGKYDIRNATFSEMTEIAKALHKAEEISFRTLATLTFDYDRATNNIKRAAQAAGMKVSADFSMYQTPADGNGRRDWIAEIGARAASDFKYGNLAGYQNNSRILEVLQRLDII